MEIGHNILIKLGEAKRYTKSLVLKARGWSLSGAVRRKFQWWEKYSEEVHSCLLFFLKFSETKLFQTQI